MSAALFPLCIRMAAMLTDTHPAVEKVQIELLRKISVAERFLKVRALTARTVGLSKGYRVKA